MLRGRRSGRGTQGRGGAGELGQSIVTIALMGMFFVLLIGLVWDVASIWMTRRDLQNSADAAVLAGVQELDCGGSQASIDAARAAAIEWAGKNEDDLDLVEPTITADSVFVRVHRDMPGFLSQFAGFDVSAKAGARATCQVDGGAAIFAGKSDTCTETAIKFGGSNVTVTGTVHSNSGLQISGSQNSFGSAVEYKTGCDSSVTVNSGQLPPAPVPVAVAVQAYPIPTAPFETLLNNMTTCTFRWSGKVDIQAGATDDTGKSVWLSGNVLRQGTYCAGGDIIVKQEGAASETGGVLFLARGDIVFSGNNLNLTGRPAISGNTRLVLAYSSNNTDPAIDVSGQNFHFEGALFAPNALVKVAGSNGSSALGSIIGLTVEISGQGFGLTGTFGTGAVTKTYSLVE